MYLGANCTGYWRLLGSYPLARVCAIRARTLALQCGALSRPSSSWGFATFRPVRVQGCLGLRELPRPLRPSAPLPMGTLACSSWYRGNVSYAGRGWGRLLIRTAKGHKRLNQNCVQTHRNRPKLCEPARQSGVQPISGVEEEHIRGGSLPSFASWCESAMKPCLVPFCFSHGLLTSLPLTSIILTPGRWLWAPLVDPVAHGTLCMEHGTNTHKAHATM